MSTHMRDPDGSIDARWNYWGTKPEINVEEVNLINLTLIINHNNQHEMTEHETMYSTYTKET